MSITVRFFASLREQLQLDRLEIPTAQVRSVADVWAAATDREFPPNVLAAVNMEYVRPDHGVTDGDEVAFFPPVTGGRA